MQVVLSQILIEMQYAFRIYTSNFDSLLVISDPKLAEQLYKNQANMSHSWDLGMGHFFVRYIGDSMGFSSGKKWANIRKAFRTTLSNASANASLQFHFSLRPYFLAKIINKIPKVPYPV